MQPGIGFAGFFVLGSTSSAITLPLGSFINKMSKVIDVIVVSLMFVMCI